MQKTGVDSPAANDSARTPTAGPGHTANPMTGAMIDTFTAPLNYFTGRGLVTLDTERLAEKLLTRDRESDDARLCLDCVHLAGHGAGAMRCTNWQRAGVAVQAGDARLSGALVHRSDAPTLMLARYSVYVIDSCFLHSVQGPAQDFWQLGRPVVRRDLTLI